MTTALLLYAHPRHSRSIANRALLDAVADLPGLTVQHLYDRYPDFAIDVPAEQALLRAHRLIIWQHPLYWYTAPALLKLWFEDVLTRGWAFGPGGTALAGKHCLWVTTTGGLDEAFTPGGMHAHPFADFTPVVQQTARFCGMHWLEPLVVHGAHRTSPAALALQAVAYRAQIVKWMAAHG